MALHDFQCPRCGGVVTDVNVPIAIGAGRWHVECPACTPNPHEPVLCEWVPQVGRMDASMGPGFTAFETYDGRGNPVQIDSLSKARAVERESEQLARNKEGQQIAFRMFSQNESNQVDNTFGSTSKRVPFKTRNTRGVPFVTAVKEAPPDA